jgi:hypothetical protein
MALIRMSTMLEEGDLAGAVATAKMLKNSGSCAAPPLMDWVNDATARLAAEDATSLLLTHGSVLNSRMG